MRATDGKIAPWQLSWRGEKLGGNSSAEVALAAPEKFDSYGASRFFMGLFLQPSKENWTGKDLAAGTTEFTKDQKIAFAIESLTGRNSSSDPITYTLVIRDSDGTPVASTSGQRDSWDAMWDGDLFYGNAPQTPQDAGTYELELYFNGQTVASKEFTIQ